MAMKRIESDIKMLHWRTRIRAKNVKYKIFQFHSRVLTVIQNKINIYV